MPLSQLRCPILIGRESARTTLEEAHVAAAAGHGSTLIFSGDAGIGKSRLIAAGRDLARQRGLTILEGQCFEPDQTLPYAPWLDLLQAYLAGRSPQEIAPALGGAAPALHQLLPDLALLLPDPAALPPLDPEQEKRRLFHALTQFILTLTTTQPVLVILEDLHWSDDTSLELVLLLARRAAAHSLLLLLSYRSEESSPSLRHLLAALDRGRLARELVLPPLTRVEMDAMLRAILARARPLQADFLDALYALTEGNPFFIEEVLQVLSSPQNAPAPEIGDQALLDMVQIPRSVQDAVLRQLSRLSAPAQRLLTLAAVAGHRFDVALLQALTGLDDVALVPQLKEAIAAHLVVEESAERFAFRHALTRQAIYLRLLARERQALHRTIAATLEAHAAGSPAAHLPDLAYHTYQARLWEQARAYARRMGEQAQALDAPRSAVVHYTHALEATQQLGQPVEPALYQARGQAYEVAGEFERAQADYACALEAAGAADDRGAEWQALGDLGFLWLARDHDQAGVFFRRALDLAVQLDDPRRHAHSLNRLGNWYANKDQPRHAQDLHQQALAIFRARPDPLGIAETLDLLAVATHIRGDRRGAITHFAAAAAGFRALQARQGLASVLATLGHLRCASRVYDTLPGAEPNTGPALGECEEALALTRAIGWRSGEAYALSELAACLSSGGEYGRALVAARASLALAEELAHGEWLAIAHSTLGIIQLDLLDADAARRHCARGYAQARATRAPHLVGLAAALLALSHLLAQEPEPAAAVLHDQVPADPPLETLTHAALLAAHGELSLAQGAPERALAGADRLIAWAAATGGAGTVPRLWKLRGEALAALGQGAEAEVTLRAAQARARDLGARPILWQIQSALGRLLQAQGRHAEADQACAAARGIIAELGATLPDEAERTAFHSRALASLPAVRPGPAGSAPAGAARRADGRLTAREHEVVTLIARGRSNRAIATELVVSERTVETHIGHIRDKLGATSRAQIAAWAVAQGLLREGA